MADILDGKAVAAEVRTEVAKGVAELKEWDIPARLDVILVGEDPASVTYRADLLVAAAGRREMVGAEHVKWGRQWWTSASTGARRGASWGTWGSRR